MKKSTILCGAFGLLALCFTACSRDISPDQAKAEFDQTQYIAVQISAPRDAGTRAFEDGTANESAVKRLDFFFYDVAGNPTSEPKTILPAEDGGNITTSPNNDANVTCIYTSVVPVALTQGQNLPSQVICIVNGVVDNLNRLKSKTLGELIDVTRTTFRNEDTFVMSNSVYYGQDVLTGRANQRLCATPINANSQLFGTEAAAADAIKGTNSNAIVDIYVERLAAKIGLTMAADAVRPYVLTNGEGEGTVSLTFTPEYWAMNATDDEVYLTKRYGVENEDGTINRLPDYSEINNALTVGGFGNWNDKTNHRSYWGCSPSYFEDNYPDVSDDVNDLAGNTTDDYGSTYLSYDEIVNQATRTDAGAGGIGKQALAAENGAFSITNTGNVAAGYIYTRETTVSKSRINNIETGNPAAAVASAVLVGKYKVTGTEDNAATFYVDRNAGEGGTYYGSETAAKNKLVSRQSIVFYANDGTSRVNDADIFALAHPTKAVRALADTKLSGRLVTLQITTVPADPLYYYNIEGANGDGAYEQVNTDNLDKVNAQLLSVGYMDMFADGMAFFSIPIRHLNWKDDYYHDGSYDWESIQSGSLGVVRNHVYTLTVNSVAGLGTALRSAAQPIVPAKEEANQYIAARLNILAWNIANTWTVDL